MFENICDEFFLEAGFTKYKGKMEGPMIYDPIAMEVSEEIDKTGSYCDGLGKTHKFPEDKPDNQKDREYIFKAIYKRRYKALRNLEIMDRRKREANG